MVLDLKILMYRNTDEVEKLKKIKEDPDREAATVLQQLKTLSEFQDLMQRELVELREVRDAAQEIDEVWRFRRRMRMNCFLWRRNFIKYPKPLKGMYPQPPVST